MNDYAAFLEGKLQHRGADGFEPTFMPDYLFPFQRELTTWAVRHGRGAIFADCGLGKTPMQLVWAENVRRKTGKPVLILTPLAVAAQTIEEAGKFGIDAAQSRDGRVAAGITVTNYQRLQHFDQADFGGVVCDESSVLKAFDGETRKMVTEFMRRMPYRLLATATAAPNDYIELGTSSEALGELGHMDMLNRFFKNDQNNTIRGMRYRCSKPQTFGDRAGRWRFKGHAEEAFWRWVSSWARALRKPSDCGFDDDGFILPELRHDLHIVAARNKMEGTLFELPALGLREEREEARRTIHERCERAAELIGGHDLSVAWVHLNDEGDLLERLIPNSLQVRGSDDPETKELAAEWFKGHLCICDRPEFRAQLAAWRNGPRGTGRTTTLDTASSASPSPSLTSRNTPESVDSTCVNGTSGTGNGSQTIDDARPTSATHAGASDMPLTRNTGRPPSLRLSATESGTRTDDSPISSRRTGSSRPTSREFSQSRAEDAPSAGGQLTMMPAAGSTSTTTTRPEHSGASSALAATSASGSSGTIQVVSNRQRCICGHVSGVRRLIAKPVMFGYGLNLQHANHMTFFPSHSYEQYYQAVRRMWRFGQTRPVTVDIVATEGGKHALENLRRKADQADRMFEALVRHMNDALHIDRASEFTREAQVPTWLAATPDDIAAPPEASRANRARPSEREASRSVSGVVE